MKFPRFARRLVALPVLRLVPILLGNRRFRKWRAANPGAPFAAFYAERIERKLRDGRHHTTLGRRGRLGGRGADVEWDRQSFAQRGLRNWADIAALGLEPSMRCVDYGCGSLRLGQHAIRFLDAGNYYGIDVTDAFIASGLELINPRLLSDKAPRFGIIDDDTLYSIAAWGPDFIFSNAVLQHVPQEDLGLYFERLERMMAPGSRAFIFYITGDRIEQFGSMSWSYPTAILHDAIRAAAPSLSIDDGSAYQGRRADGRRREVIGLRRQGA